MPEPQVEPKVEPPVAAQVECPVEPAPPVKPVQEDSRGIVHPAAAHTVFRLDRFPPTGDAARFVDRYWISTWHLPPGVRHEQQVLVHPVVNVVFEADKAIVSGVDTGRFAITLEGRGRALGIMFRPAAFAPFFDGPLTELTDRELPLAQVPALAGLEALLVPMVADLDVPAQQIAEAADAALLGRVPADRQDCETTTEWAELAVRDRKLTRVEDLARAAGVGIRTLQRAFTEHVGIGPKWFLRRYRLYEAGERIAHEEDVEWSELAADLGYADQSHLTRDFTAAFGLPPAQYAAAARKQPAESTEPAPSPPSPLIPPIPLSPPTPGADMADTAAPDASTSDPASRDLLATFAGLRHRLFARLEGLTDAEYHWEPVADCVGIHPGEDGVFGVEELFPQSAPGVPDPVTTIAWRIWHIGNLCLRGYVIHFFDDVPSLGDRREWPGTAKEGVQAMAEDWERFTSRIAALGDKRLLEPMGLGPWAHETYLKLALHALDEVAHHGGEIGLLRDLYLRATA